MMIIDFPLTITAGLGTIPPRRWLVYQTQGDGAVVYAQAFARRSSAERAREAANARRRFFSTRNLARVICLPYDHR